jgi:formylglycine-generating enzyme required for sulfatase activity
VLRGGSWVGEQVFARSAFRYGSGPRDRVNLFGFRVVCVSPIPER